MARSRLSHRSPASALLIVVLIMAAAGAIILTAARSVVSSARTASAAQFAEEANQMAESGIEMGLLRYKNRIAQPYEYGNGAVANALATATSYSLLPMRRGFTDSGCTNLSLDGPADSTNTTGINLDCPYYDLTVRSMVALTSGGTTYWDYTSRELPPNTAVSLHLLQFAPFSLVAGNSGLSFSAQNGATVVDSGNLTSGSSHAFTTQFTTLQLNVSGSSCASVSAGGCTRLSYTGPGTLAIEKGYVTIDATGYSGGVQERKLLTYRASDPLASPPNTTSENLLPFAQSFDSAGILH